MDDRELAGRLERIEMKIDQITEIIAADIEEQTREEEEEGDENETPESVEPTEKRRKIRPKREE